MARSFLALTAMNTGIKPDHLVAMRINLPRANYPTAELRAQFFERLTPRLASLPGADAAAVTTSVPAVRPVDAAKCWSTAGPTPAAASGSKPAT